MRDEAAHREVDDRRGDVEQVRLLVDERADLAGPHLVGRHELDRSRVLLARAGCVAPRRSRCPARRRPPSRSSAGRGRAGRRARSPRRCRAPRARRSTPSVPALTANASSSVRRSSRIGFGSGWIAPLGRPTTIVMPAPGAELGLRERRRCDRTRRLGARQRAAVGSGEARDLGDVGRRLRPCTRRGLDRHRPLVADHVPVQLVVIGEREQRARDRVVDRVRVLAGDRAVRIADADPAGTILRRRAARRRACPALADTPVDVDVVAAGRGRRRSVSLRTRSRWMP